MSDCIFCKIANGEIPSYTLFENDVVKIILDHLPSSIGHTLVLPKKHYDSIYDLPPNEGADIFAYCVKAANALKQALNFDGLNVLQNNGTAAGQTVNHFHIHLIPRYDDDSLVIDWQTQTPKQEEFLAAVEKIKGFFK